MGGAAARGTCAACAALARLWRRTSATRDRPARQPHTARPTRRVSCRSQAVRSSWPCCAPLRRAHCRLRARRVARVALAETARVRPQARAPPMRWRPAAASRICTSACAPDPGSKPEPKPKPKPNLSPGPGHCAHRSGSRPPLQRGARVPACTSPIFCPMCLTARNGSRGGRLERTQGEHPHVLGLCDVCWKGVAPRTLPAPKFSFLEFCPPFW